MQISTVFKDGAASINLMNDVATRIAVRITCDKHVLFCDAKKIADHIAVSGVDLRQSGVPDDLIAVLNDACSETQGRAMVASLNVRDREVKLTTPQSELLKLTRG